MPAVVAQSSMMQQVLEGVAIILVLGTAISIVIAVRGRIGDDQLEDWARRTGLHLLSAEPQWINPGPFWFRMGGGKVYRIVAEDKSGARRSGYVRCGIEVEVEWDR